MLIDYNLQMSDAQSVTADAASTNVIDLGSDRDIGPGEEMKIALNFDVAMGGSSPTLAVQVQTDDNSSFSSEIWAHISSGESIEPGAFESNFHSPFISTDR